MRVSMDWIKEKGKEVAKMPGTHSQAARKKIIERICLERDFIERTSYEDALEDEVVRLRLGVK